MKTIIQKSYRVASLAALSILGAITIAAQPVEAYTESQPISGASLTEPRAISANGVPSSCLPYLNTDDVLDCYLGHIHNWEIAAAISWTFDDLDHPAYLSWLEWPSAARADLRQAFHDVVAWYKGGMVGTPGLTMRAEEPPQLLNVAQLMSPKGGVSPQIDRRSAWSLFVGHIALMLATDIYRWVPWSLHDYDQNSLGALFNMHMWPCVYSTAGYCLGAHATPASAFYTLRFLKTNGLIGPTPVATIGRLLEWSQRLWHYIGDGTPQNGFYHWQYWGSHRCLALLKVR